MKKSYQSLGLIVVQKNRNSYTAYKFSEAINLQKQILKKTCNHYNYKSQLNFIDTVLF